MNMAEERSLPSSEAQTGPGGDDEERKEANPQPWRDQESTRSNPKASFLPGVGSSAYRTPENYRLCSGRGQSIYYKARSSTKPIIPPPDCQTPSFLQYSSESITKSRNQIFNELLALFLNKGQIENPKKKTRSEEIHRWREEEVRRIGISEAPRVLWLGSNGGGNMGNRRRNLKRRGWASSLSLEDTLYHLTHQSSMSWSKNHSTISLAQLWEEEDQIF